MANSAPKQDFEKILEAIDNIKKINPKKLVLISTIDVYKKPLGVDEYTVIDTKDMLPYGGNRYYLEQWVSKHVEDYHIVRLPGLFGENIKKNFIYDLIHVIPSMLRQDKFEALSNKNEILKKYYVPWENGFYKCIDLKPEDVSILKAVFSELGFSALNFTDSRASYQFYNLSYLWHHIESVIDNELNLINLAVEPVTVNEIYRAVNNTDFSNEILEADKVPAYNFKTVYAAYFGGKHGYIFNKRQVISDIVKFVKNHN